MSLPNFDLNPNRSEANSFVSYVGDGVTKEYRFDIDYLRREFIKVEINGVRQTGWVFKEDRVIVLAQPVPVEDILTIKRITDATRIVEFIDGSILKSKDLNISAIQTVHISEEARDYMTNTVGVDDEGNIDARFKRVVRVQDAVDDFDATNKRYVDTEGQFAMANAHASATAAKASEDAAKVSEGKAKDSETKAKASEVAAKDSETKAKASEVAAAASAKAAKDSENVVVPLVPVVDQASKDAANAAQMADDASKRAEQAVVDVKSLGAVPLGAVLVFIKEPLPAGYLALRGGKFDKLTFPDLFELLGTDDLPDFTDRVPKMVGADLTLLEKQGWCWPQHSHTMSEDRHSHTRGSMNITGSMIQGGNEAVFWKPDMRLDGAFFSSGGEGQINAAMTSGGYTGTVRQFNLDASRSWTGETSSHAHTHTINPVGNSNRVDVDRIGVVYAIKAAGVIATEGMAQMDGVLNRVGALEAHDRDVIAPELARLDATKVSKPASLALSEMSEIAGLPLGSSKWNFDQLYKIPEGTYWWDGSNYNGSPRVQAFSWLSVPDRLRGYPYGNVVISKSNNAITFTLIPHKNTGNFILDGFIYYGESEVTWHPRGACINTAPELIFNGRWEGNAIITVSMPGAFKYYTTWKWATGLGAPWDVVYTTNPPTVSVDKAPSCFRVNDGIYNIVPINGNWFDATQYKMNNWYPTNTHSVGEIWVVRS